MGRPSLGLSREAMLKRRCDHKRKRQEAKRGSATLGRKRKYLNDDIQKEARRLQRRISQSNIAKKKKESRLLLLSTFESIQFIVKGKPVTVTRGIFPLPIHFYSENYIDSYNHFFKNGLQFKKCKRSTCSLFGSTIFGCNHPYLFYDVITRKNKVLPRLNAICKPGGTGEKIMNSSMIKKMAVNAYTLLSKHCPDLVEVLQRAISIIPEELRFSDTPFTGLAFVGNLEDGENRPHLDNDLASIIITLGKNISGGKTNYYNPNNFKSKNPEVTKGDCVAEVDFEHGQYQIAPFHRVVHSGSKWKGKRGVLSFFVTQNLSLIHISEPTRPC